MVAQADLARFAPHALALVESHLDERERAVVTEAVKALDSEHGLSPDEALQAIMAVREVRRLHGKLKAGVKTVEARARDHAEALSQ